MADTDEAWRGGQEGGSDEGDEGSGEEGRGGSGEESDDSEEGDGMQDFEELHARLRSL